MRFHDLRQGAASLLLSQGVHPRGRDADARPFEHRSDDDTNSHVIPQLKRDAADHMEVVLPAADWSSTTCHAEAATTGHCPASPTTTRPTGRRSRHSTGAPRTIRSRSMSRASTSIPPHRSSGPWAESWTGWTDTHPPGPRLNDRRSADSTRALRRFRRLVRREPGPIAAVRRTACGLALRAYADSAAQLEPLRRAPPVTDTGGSATSRPH